MPFRKACQIIFCRAKHGGGLPRQIEAKVNFVIGQGGKLRNRAAMYFLRNPGKSNVT
jgi:hypothetical protein